MRYYYQTVEHLSPYQTQICKGLAILFIVVHNFFSKLSNRPYYNEMTFDNNRFWDALSITYADPAEFVRIFMTFLGHYGVQVFIFLSAYGLTRSIGNQPQIWHAFVLKRIKQLLLPMILVMLFFLTLDYFSGGIFNVRSGPYNIWDVLLRMLFISNFVPGKTFLVIGPWWFLSLIMQFYCVFLLLHAMQLRWGNASLAILSLFVIMLLMEFEPWLAQHKLFLNSTAAGHLPEFALGMYVASLDKIKIPLWLFLVACVGLILGNTIRFFWYFAPLCSIIVIMTLYVNLIKYISPNHILLRALGYVGMLSMYIFLLNGVIREPFIPYAKIGYDSFTALVYTGIVTLLCILAAQGFYVFEGYLKKFWNRCFISTSEKYKQPQTIK